MGASENETGVRSFTAGSDLEAFRRVVYNGTSVSYATAGEPYDGTTLNKVVSGDQVAVKLANFAGTRRMVASAAISAGAAVYGSASGKISATKIGRPIGRAVKAASGDGSEIEVETIELNVGSLVKTTVAAGTTLTNTTTETSLGDTYVIPAGSLRAGDVIKIRSHGTTPSTNSTDTLTVKIKIGSNIILATAATDVANNDAWTLDATIQVRTIGASGTIISFGAAGLGVPGTATMRVSNMASATVDTTGDLTIDVTGTWSAASASDQAAQQALIVEHLRAAA